MSKIVIDVREANEFSAGHADGALNIALSELAQNSSKLRDLPKDAEIIVYCNSGNRSGVAKRILEANGYTNVTNGINKQRAAEILAS